MPGRRAGSGVGCSTLYFAESSKQGRKKLYCKDDSLCPSSHIIIYGPQCIGLKLKIVSYCSIWPSAIHHLKTCLSICLYRLIADHKVHGALSVGVEPVVGAGQLTKQVQQPVRVNIHCTNRTTFCHSSYLKEEFVSVFVWRFNSVRVLTQIKQL